MGAAEILREAAMKVVWQSQAQAQPSPKEGASGRPQALRRGALCSVHPWRELSIGSFPKELAFCPGVRTEFAVKEIHPSAEGSRQSAGLPRTCNGRATSRGRPA